MSAQCKPTCASRCTALFLAEVNHNRCERGHTSHACDCGATSHKATCATNCIVASRHCDAHDPSHACDCGAGETEAKATPARLDADRKATGKTILTAPAMGMNGPSHWPGNASSHIDLETGKRTSLAGEEAHGGEEHYQPTADDLHDAAAARSEPEATKLAEAPEAPERVTLVLVDLNLGEPALVLDDPTWGRTFPRVDYTRTDLAEQRVREAEERAERECAMYRGSPNADFMHELFKRGWGGGTVTAAVKEAFARLDTARSEVARLEAELAEAKDACAAYVARIGIVSEERDTARSELEEARAEIEREREYHQIAIDRMKEAHAAEIERLRAEHERTVEKERDDFGAMIDERDAEIERLRAREAEVLAMIDEYKRAWTKDTRNDVPDRIRKLLEAK